VRRAPRRRGTRRRRARRHGRRGAVALFGWIWVDPTLSFGIGLWLAWWVLRLLVRRIRRGAGIWAQEPT
jgi:hypothetical protein